MDEWREVSLYEVGKDFAMGPFGSNIKAENFGPTGVPVIKGKNLNFFKYVGGDFDCLIEEKADELVKSNCYPDDLVFTHRGTIGQVGLIPKGKYPRYVISQSGMKVATNKEFLIPDFLFYFFKSNIGQHELLQNESQVGVPSISSPLTSLKNVRLSLPPLPEQKAIAGVLSCLDDKIDLLHRQNKTLESLVETLFRQTFIENAQDDWEEKSLLDLIDLVGGGTPKTSVDKYWFMGEIPWLSGGDIASSHKSILTKSDKLITEEGLESSSAKLLPRLSTVISARGTVGKYALLSQPMSYSQSNYGILPRIENCFFFTYLLINHAVSELQSAAYGSVFDTITTATFKDVTVKVPKDSQIKEFEQTVATYFNKKLNCIEQIQTLENLRDTLLPKLMSGEVRVQYDGAA